MNRRQFLAISAAIPLPALARPVSPRLESPLFPVITGEVVEFCMAVRQDAVALGPYHPLHQLRHSIDESPYDAALYYWTMKHHERGERADGPWVRHTYQIDASDGLRIDSIEHAEDLILDRAMMYCREVSTQHVFPEPRITWLVEDGGSPAIMANRCANRIASNTRVGLGNRLFMHPETYAYAKGVSSSAFSDRERRRVGRWVNIASMYANRMLDVYLSDHMPIGTGVVAHVSDTTFGSAVMVTPSGLVFVQTVISSYYTKAFRNVVKTLDHRTNTWNITWPQA